MSGSLNVDFEGDGLHFFGARIDALFARNTDILEGRDWEGGFFGLLVDLGEVLEVDLVVESVDLYWNVFLAHFADRLASK